MDKATDSLLNILQLFQQFTHVFMHAMPSGFLSAGGLAGC
jgi:hypothetical protein